MSLDLEMANAAIAERKFGDAGTADEIERWRREVAELRRDNERLQDVTLHAQLVATAFRLRSEDALIKALRGLDRVVAMLEEAEGAKP